ncbi:trimeric intracellular cation channel family protein [Naumannella halotolerans]|uniref:trimeric intracellular cation channel family protein n=1 Tax=Naumannella halotolerans TaxID=993414 RepID=UPI001AAF4CF8|nr:TRIC cation channel family protein [Naumannella halotolerans]
MEAAETALTAIGIFAFALSGALMAVRKDMDVVGMFVLAAITAVGGGALRDLLLGLPPAALRSSWWWILIALATAVVFFFHLAVDRLRRAVLVCDAAGLAVFCTTSTTIAHQVGMGPAESVLIGAIGGCAGGVLRDVLAGEIPSVLRKGTTLYVLPALLGCAIVVAVRSAGYEGVAAMIGASILIIVLRLLSLWRGWQAPSPKASRG